MGAVLLFTTKHPFFVILLSFLACLNLDIQEFITPTFYGLCDFSMLIFPSSGVHP